ncbi:hypothetical protein LTR70_009998 [Exophiala xenobiotica]|uniref:Uncharacterized protein n=1 Tax=Lithohypha guttulata TaxID=1690604 RepID=A0ABR0JVT2_9EURO|nr:hypothetical protein LTR24_009874 [Lithohypha guttulata]KAK5309775.1 hypothetical protein LTR70_009998 [Exophiala xenobiotica]
MATGGVAEADLKKAQSNVEQSGVEPPSGIQGRGTADEPYDQGNQPAQATGPGVEPPSGQQGKGTIDQPYDQGNQPDQNAENAPMSIVDQLSRTRTKDEIACKNQRRKASQAGIEQVKTNGTTAPPPQPPPPTTITTEPPRGRDESRSTTAASAPKDVDTTKLAPKRESRRNPD